MTIKGAYISKRSGIMFEVSYEEMDSFDSISHMPIFAAGAFCFYRDKLVLVYAKKRDSWEIPGGGRDDGESFDACVIREIKEETNMKVLELFPLGLDSYINSKTGDTSYAVRYAAKVKPYGDFVADAAHDADITEIKLIDPVDCSKYFDWEERGVAMIAKAKTLLGIK